MFARDLAAELRRLRADSGLGLVQLAVRTNYSKSSLERYLNGKVLPPRRAVEAISKACGGDTARLLALWELACQPPPSTVAADPPPQRPLAPLSEDLRDERQTTANEQTAAELRHIRSGIDRLSRVAYPGPLAAELDGGGLPGEVEHFTGRQGPLEELLRRVDAYDPAGSVVSVYVIDGMPGVGKTAFVIHAAHQLADRYPDGAIFVDLLGFTGPALSVPQALDELLAQAGVPRARIPGQDGPKQALWRRLMRGRQTLIVLDNARDAGQVEPLLPHSPRCLVLITARSKLYELDATPLPLPVLTAGEARSLFVAIAGAERCRNEAALEQIVAGCHRLPLALRLMAGRVRHGDPITEVADDITALPEEKKIRGVFDLSYGSLDADLQRAVRLLGVYPGVDITGPVMATLADTSPTEGRRLLRGLAIHNLIDRSPDHSGERGSQVRYQPHDLSRDYARSRADAHEPPASRQAALDRLVAHYLAMVHAVKHLHDRPEATPSTAGAVFEGLAHGHAWLITERANLLACLTNSPTPSVDLARTAAGLLGRLSYWRDAAHCCRLALTRHRETGDRHGEADALWELADLDRLLGRSETAQHRFEQAHAIYREIGNRHGEAYALWGLADLDRLLGRSEAAQHRFEQAHAICQEIGNRQGEAYALWGLAEVDRLFGRYKAAQHRFEQARAICQEIGNRQGEAHALRGLADLDRLLGRSETAQHRFEQARAIYREIGNRQGEAYALWGLAEVDRLFGRSETAQHRFEQARAIYREIGNRQGEAHALRGLADVDVTLGRYEAARQRYEQARAICQEIGNRQGEAYALWGLAEVDRLFGRYKAAQHRFEQARAICQEIGNRQGEAHALRGLAEVDRLFGRSEAAQHRFEQAHAIYREIGNRHGEAYALRGLADVDVTLGRSEAAQYRFEQARAIYREIGNRQGEAHALRGLADVDVTLGRYEAARQRYEQARAICQEIGDRHGEAFALWGLGKVAEAMDDTDTAADRWWEALQILDTLQLPFAGTVQDALAELN